MKFEGIIEELGHFGPLQQRGLFLLSLAIFCQSFSILPVIFTMKTQNHRCVIPGLSNDTFAVQDAWHNEVINRWIPAGDSGLTYSPCTIYVKDNSTGQMTNNTQACDRYVYDTSTLRTTFTSEMNLVCELKSRTTYLNMMFMAGMLVGSLFFGVLSDATGRKKSLALSTGLLFGFSLATAFSPTYLAYGILRFLAGTCGIGSSLVLFVMVQETFSAKLRIASGTAAPFFWVVGELLLTLIAYLLPEWNYIHIVVAVPMGISCTLCVLLLRESPRWLILKERYEEAREVLESYAKLNKVTLSEEAKDVSRLEREGAAGNILQMFTSKVLLFRSLILLYIWWVCSLTYYGLTLNVSALSGNVFLNFTLSSLAEAPSYLTVYLLVDRIGRKKLICITCFLAGVACIGTLFPYMYGGDDLQWLTQVLALVGKFAVSCYFTVVYMYTVELFPTSVRSSGMGLCSVSSRIGGIIAPYIADLGKVVTGDLGVILPLIIFGGVSLIAGFLVLTLPETTNRQIPETIQESKEFGRKTTPSKTNYSRNSYNINHGFDDKDMKFTNVH